MVRRVIDLFYQEVKGLHQAAYILAFFAFGSQILAVVRDRLLAGTFGAGQQLDLYYAAFRIPDLMFVLFGSILSVYVLLPFVSREEEEKVNSNKPSILSQVFSLYLVIYLVVAMLLFITTPYLIPLMFPGFIDQADTITLLTRILLLQPFLLGLSNLCGVVTQMGHRFVIYAISPLIYNFGIIFGVLVLYPHLGLTGLVVGVVVGAFGHMAIQYPLIRSSSLRFAFTKVFDFSLLRSILVVAIPRALTLSIQQMSLLVLVSFASLMAVGSVSVFQFAFNLQSVPLVIVGMSYSVAAFPVLAKMVAKDELKEFCQHLLIAMRHIIFWSLPIIALVIVLRAQIVRVLLGTGSFDWSDTRLTAAVLAVMMVALLAQAIQLLLVRAYYASGLTLVPFVTATIGFGVTVILSWLFWHYYQSTPAFQSLLVEVLRLEEVPGAEVLVLAFAYVIGVLIQVGLLLGASIKTFALPVTGLTKQISQSLLASLAGAVASYATLIFIVEGVNQDTFLGIFMQGLAGGVMGLVAIVLTYLAVGSKELKEIYRSFHTRIFKTDIIAPQPDNL